MMFRALIVCVVVTSTSYAYAQLPQVIGVLGWWMEKGGPALSNSLQGLGITKPMQAAKAPPPPKSTFTLTNPTNTQVQFQLKSASCPNADLTIDPGGSAILGCTLGDDKVYYALVEGNRYVLHAGHTYHYGIEADGWPAFLE